jgi:hypothetical protein
MSRQTVTVPGTEQPAFVWIGVVVVVAQAAMVVAVGLAGDGLVARMASGSFGLRQPLVAAVGVLAVLSPIAGLVWWVAVAPHGDLYRQDVTPLPAYMADSLVSDASLRALVIRRDGDAVTYELIAGNGLRLGDESVLPDEESTALTVVVGDLLSQPQPGDVRTLAAMGVAYLVLPRPTVAADVAALDAVPGLTRASTDLSELDGWQVPAPPPSRGGDRSAAAVFADQPGYLSDHRTWWLAGQGASWVVAVILAAPAISTRSGIVRAEP